MCSDKCSGLVRGGMYVKLSEVYKTVEATEVGHSDK